MTVRLAVVMTCHNRRQKTLACLEAVSRQEFDGELDVFLVDDASTDGTGDAVRAAFPQVKVIEGTGDLFWIHGMRLALEHAYRGDYDYYLWLNDDTFLDDGALRILLRTATSLEKRRGRPIMVFGATRDPDTGALTYSGLERRSPARRARFSMVAPGDEPIQVETSHGNVLLVPREVTKRIGNIYPGYRHSFGDEDYGLCAREAGCEVWLAPGSLATCTRNPLVTYGQQSLREEFTSLFGVKGLPLGCWLTFTRRWAGPLWPLYWLSPYARQAGRMVLARLGAGRTSLPAGLTPADR